MAQIPKPILNIADKMAAKHSGDITLAVATALKAIRKLPEFREYVEILVHQSVQDLVYAARHQDNRQIKYANGDYHAAQKVRPADSEGVIRAAQNALFEYRIGGSRLGLLLGKDLLSIAATERAIGSGHFFNAALVEGLAPMVPAEKTVEESVSEAKLNRIFRELSGEMGKDAA